MIECAPTYKVKNYEEAWLYCVTCKHDNKYDWRLPTPDEWQFTSAKVLAIEAYYDNDAFFKVEPPMQDTASPVREVK